MELYHGSYMAIPFPEIIKGKFKVNLRKISGKVFIVPN